jgi:hypothetical protein
MVLSRIEARRLLAEVTAMTEGDDLAFMHGPYYRVSPSLKD